MVEKNFITFAVRVRQHRLREWSKTTTTKKKKENVRPISQFIVYCSNSRTQKKKKEGKTKRNKISASSQEETYCSLHVLNRFTRLTSNHRSITNNRKSETLTSAHETVSIVKAEDSKNGRDLQKKKKETKRNLVRGTVDK